MGQLLILCVAILLSTLRPISSVLHHKKNPGLSYFNYTRTTEKREFQRKDADGEILATKRLRDVIYCRDNFTNRHTVNTSLSVCVCVFICVRGCAIKGDLFIRVLCVCVDSCICIR